MSGTYIFFVVFTSRVTTAAAAGGGDDDGLVCWQKADTRTSKVMVQSIVIMGGLQLCDCEMLSPELACARAHVFVVNAGKVDVVVGVGG